MDQDEQFVSSSNSAGGGDDDKSKNGKPKKAPQRGLGVAQLERIRLEEQRNREAANALTNNAIASAHDPTQCPNISPNPISDEMGLLRGVSSWPRLWSGEYNNNNNYNYNVDGEGGDKHRVEFDHHHNVGFAFGPQVNINFQYDPNCPALPVYGGGPQRSFQSSSVVNVSSGISASSFPSSQTEPPSIQRSSWPEDNNNKTVVGMKRAYPFNLDILSNFHASGSRFEEFRTRNNEPRNEYIREGYLSIPPGPEQNPVEDSRLIGDFLMLGPPVAACTPLSSKNKHPMEYCGRKCLDLSDNRSLSSQENLRNSQAHREGSTEQTFSFFPIKPRTDQAIAHVRNGNAEKVEKLDLNLKL
ncbi:hypothetical protein CASFOL_017883 [Castilleja foliolosa]|uniref:Uncharacterized protein n=1 Tax=Castilleja foliolosa TaxID=1961234 RepID=A0ABD3D9Z4_9LAMI